MRIANSQFAIRNSQQGNGAWKNRARYFLLSLRCFAGLNFFESTTHLRHFCLFTSTWWLPVQTNRCTAHYGAGIRLDTPHTIESLRVTFVAQRLNALPNLSICIRQSALAPLAPENKVATRASDRCAFCSGELGSEFRTKMATVIFKVRDWGKQQINSQNCECAIWKIHFLLACKLTTGSRTIARPMSSSIVGAITFYDPQKNTIVSLLKHFCRDFTLTYCINPIKI